MSALGEQEYPARGFAHAMTPDSGITLGHLGERAPFDCLQTGYPGSAGPVGNLSLPDESNLHAA